MFLKGKIIQKPGKIELWFFDTALPLNAHYHCMGFKLCPGQDNGQTDGRTDGQGGDYMLSLRGT
jgi:hypothetical protein